MALVWDVVSMRRAERRGSGSLEEVGTKRMRRRRTRRQKGQKNRKQKKRKVPWLAGLLTMRKMA
jgi:hypothetical protein